MADYGMFSSEGNTAVDAIVKRAKVLDVTWPQVYNDLQELSKNDDYAEAMDTVVREIVYDKVGFTTPFYF